MKRVLLSLVVAGSFSSVSARAEDLTEIFKKVNEYVGAKNYAKALEELSWARKEIEKMNSGQIQSFFPDSLAGFTGGKIEANSALGFSNLEREYTKGELAVRVSLTGGGEGLAGGFGNLAAFGKMAAMAEGGGSGRDTLRIGGRTAVLNQDNEGNSADLTVFLDSGSILKFESSSGAKGDTLKSMAEAIKVADLDAYLKG